MTFDTDSTLPVSDTHMQAALSAQFGVATIASPSRNPRANQVTHDCGKVAGRLTAKQIAAMTGLSREGVWKRIEAGVTGRRLLEPKYEGARKVKEPCRRPVMSVAMKLARAFPGRLPTTTEIRKVHPMGVRNALRWRQAMADAKEKLA